MRVTRRRARVLLLREWQSLTTINPSDRPWQMAIAAALASGLPLLVAAVFDHLAYGVIGSLGGLVFLYLPNASLMRRMKVLLACSGGLIASYAVGLATHSVPLIQIPAIGTLAFAVTAVTRVFRLGPPGPVFFIMAAAIGAYTPGAPSDAPLKVALLATGCAGGVAVAFVYSAYILRLRKPPPATPRPAFDLDFVVIHALLLALAVAASLAVAQGLKLDRPYWAPVSCVAVMQGLTMRAVWTRQIHRLLGTVLGLLIAAALLSLPANAWLLAAMVMALTFIIENAVTRHYGFAVMFITPLALFLAEAPTLGHAPVPQIMMARLADTAVGCVVGLLGGLALNHAGLRRTLTRTFGGAPR